MPPLVVAELSFASGHTMVARDSGHWPQWGLVPSCSGLLSVNQVPEAQLSETRRISFSSSGVIKALGHEQGPRKTHAGDEGGSRASETERAHSVSTHIGKRVSGFCQISKGSKSL